MVIIFEQDGCSHMARAKYSGEIISAAHKVAESLRIEIDQSWNEELRKLEDESISLPARVQKLCYEGLLSVVVGAGVSISCGLPSWPNLVRETFNYVLGRRHFTRMEINSIIESLLFQDDLMSLAEAATALLPDETELSSAVASVLYREPLKESELLSSLADLIAVMYRRNISQNIPTIVSTFNYDTLIEWALKKRDIPVATLTPNGDRKWQISKLEYDVVNVIHPHGALRYDSSSSNGYGSTDINQLEQPIVLTESSYGNVYIRAPGDDPLSQTLSAGLMPLFVGFSFRDQYVRRVLKERFADSTMAAIGLLADADLFDKGQLTLQAPNLNDQSFSPNDRVGWATTGLSPAKVHELRASVVNDVPSRFARWALRSIGVEWLRVNDHNNLPNVLRAIVS